MIITLLIIITICEVARFIIPYIPRPFRKKSYFKQRLTGTERLIWDLEFKIFKTREIREDVRKEYSYTQAKVNALEEQIKNWPNDKDQAEKKKLEDAVVLSKRDTERYEAQMKQLDVEIEGTKPTNDYPEGVDGIVQQIDSLKEVQSMLRDWIKSV